MSSIKIRTKRLNNQMQIRTLITHPMDNGRIKDKQGNIIPAHHIEELVVMHNDAVITTCHMAGSISKNPYFDFLLNGGEVGDKITVLWSDNLGITNSQEHIVK